MWHPDLKKRVEALLGEPIVSERQPSGGYTGAIRLICETPSRSMFAKIGTDPFTISGVLREIELYSALKLPCMPQLIAADPDATSPILVLEDLSHHHWPPPWQPGQLDLAVKALRQLHETSVPAGVLTAFEEQYDDIHGWIRVAEDPSSLLATGIVDADWLRSALPALVDAEGRCPLGGDAVIHNDLRSDNLCIGPNGITMVDWNWACIGNPQQDLAFFLNAVHAEGGPAQETHLGHAPEQAALVSGLFAHRFPLPPIPTAPHVRNIQKQQFVGALPWVIRALNLPPL